MSAALDSAGGQLDAGTVESLNAGDLNIGVEEQATTLLLTWLGKSSERQPGKFLEPFFDGVIEHADAKKIAIEMRFEKLEYFNSSTISSLIQMLQKARTRSVRLVIQYNAAIRWQKLSFDALRVFNKGDDLLELRALS
jgi:hypothetical protein